MYYYIFDIKKCKKRSVVTDIKNYLSSLGISGEFTYPSAAYSTEELVDLGISKKYNTIVGIGDDEIASKIAGRLCGRSEAMGLIPLEASSDLSALIRAKNWRDAADNLRYRRIEEIKIGRTANGGAFLTTLELDLKNPTEVTIEFKDFLAQGIFKNLLISNFSQAVEKLSPDHLDIVVQSVEKSHGLFSKFSSLFSHSKANENDISIFHARSLRVFTSAQVQLVAPGGPVAKTPQLLESSDENLRLIVGKK